MNKRFLRAKNFTLFCLFSLGGLLSLIIVKPDIITFTKFKLNTSYRLKKYVYHPIHNLYDSYRFQLEEKESWNFRKRKISSAWHNIIKEVIPARKFLYYYGSKKRIVRLYLEDTLTILIQIWFWELMERERCFL